MITPEFIKNNIHQVPMLSPAASRLILLLGDADHSLSDITKLIEIDPNLTMLVLRTANSAAFTRANEIHSLHMAVALLGEQTVFSIAMRSCAGEMLMSPMEGYLADESCLWRHSVFTAIAARALVKQCKLDVDPELAYTAGLLHDIGKAIINVHLKEESDEFMRRCRNPLQHDFSELEVELLGMNHAQVGQILAEHWKLPPTISATILHHHQVTQALDEDRALVEAVHIADILAMMAGFSTGIDTLKYKVDLKDLKFVSFEGNTLERLLSDAQEEFQVLGEALSD